MKEILNYLIDYQRKHFDLKLYLAIGLFLLVSLIINFKFDFENSYIDDYSGEWIRWLWMFLFQAFPFLFVCLLLTFFQKNTTWYKSTDFWIKLIIGFGLLGADRAFHPYYLLDDILPRTEIRFISRSLNWCSSLFIVVIPLLLMSYYFERERPRILYGIIWKKFNPTPYLIMLGIAGIFLLIGSFMADIQDYYPRYWHSGGNLFAHTRKWPTWTTMLIYEAAYGSNFISVELFFRGFLILSLSRYLGPHVVLPMAATYCYLHFGKPLGEAVTSIFGGYVLGIISLNSRNIWGGIMIHLGVAWLMELLGYLQLILNS